MKIDRVDERRHIAVAVGDALDLLDLWVEQLRVGVGHAGGGRHPRCLSDGSRPCP